MALSFLTDPRIKDRIRTGEEVRAVVRKHWIAYWRVLLEAVVAGGLFLLYANQPASGWIFFWLGAALSVHAFGLFVYLASDVFVVTNRRVFRVRGPLRWGFATMPATRIVDYSVRESVAAQLLGRTFLGQWFDYGHFVFESAAQEQALREIRYVPDPLACENAIQDVVQGNVRQR
ncbi:MAG TPA: PH domain-containing protein [Nocardioidaceae bacterium]|nr:PH domain-containing protein [Nocardioidaceae bacterium]